MSQVTRAGSVAGESRSAGSAGAAGSAEGECLLPRATRSASASAVAPPTGSSGCGRATTRTCRGPCPTDSIRIGRPAREVPIRRRRPVPGYRETSRRADSVTSATVG